MKKVLAILMALCMMMSVCAFAEEVAPEVVDAKIVTKVLEEGQVIAGVRLEYDKAWETGALTTSSYSVVGYDVIQLYVNNSGEPNVAEATGKYVYVIFDEPSGIGTGAFGTLQYKGGQNLLREYSLDVKISATQTFVEAKGYIHLEVDEFIEADVTDAEGYTTEYRLYIPEETAEDLPLVIWLHGAGERGDNNIAQIAANRGALNYMTAEAQAAHPCYVLAPQAHPTGWDASAIANINTVVLDLIENYNIDASRIYVSGCSMGGMGSKSLMLAYPEMIAASVVTANGSFLTDEAQLATLKDIPVITITAADDGSAGANMIANYEQIKELGYNVVGFLGENGRNGYLRGELAAQDLQPVIDAMAEAEANWALVTYLPGTVVPQAHWSWMAATDNAALHDWMFAQVNDAPYAG